MLAILSSVIIFVIVLVVLILVHELGHFIAAKLSGMRVDEFGIGYPPRALTIAKYKGTEYTLNWLPFGGFVKIYGEDGITAEKNREGAETVGVDKPAPAAPADSFVARPRMLQAITLIAGVAMNVVFAYIVFTIGLVIGTQQVLDSTQAATTKDAIIVIADVVKGGPADAAGFKRGDEVLSATTTIPGAFINYNGGQAAGLVSLINQDSEMKPMQFLVRRNGNDLHIEATPKKGIVPGAPDRLGLGVTLASFGTLKTPFMDAPMQGLTYTWESTKEVATQLGLLVWNAVQFKADLSEVSGPVGIAKAVGQASDTGLGSLLTLTGLISINLAIVNLIPIPALDGGRLLFVIIEAIRRKPMSAKISERINMISFGLLILLMVVVTAHDIFNLFV